MEAREKTGLVKLLTRSRKLRKLKRRVDSGELSYDDALIELNNIIYHR